MTKGLQQILKKLDAIFAASGGGGLSEAQVQALIDASAPSGGVIGTASFTGGGAVGSLVNDGIISNVTYVTTGRYDVVFASSQPDTNYRVNAITVAAASHRFYSISDKTVDGLRLHSMDETGTEADSNAVELTINRLSQ